MSCETEIHINTDHFNERLASKGLSLFDVYAYLYPDKAAVCKTSTDRNSAVRKIRNWQDGFSMPKTINELLSLCELFDCDVEYIIGKQHHFRNDSLDAIERTGLDEITIEELSKLSDTEKHIVNALFSRTIGSFNLLKLIKEMLFYSHPNTQNKTKITLDEGLTNRDSEYSELENKLNESSIADIFSFRLGIEMNYIIESLIRDTDLSNEIYTDYKNKHFKKHIRPLADSELPKIICKPDGTLMIDIDDEIEKMETTIIERLKHRDKNNVKCDYGIDWLHQCDDFINEIKVKRNLLNDKDYLAWLKEIMNLTS